MVYSKKFRGFTLAEVLITLVIVGVIASMTIPTLMNNTNKQEYVSRLKKTYSIMAQATNRIIAEEGNPRGDIGGWATSTEAVYNMYKKHLSLSKDCGSGADCFEKMTSDNNFYKKLNGNSYYSASFTTNDQFYKVITADGAQILFAFNYPDCAYTTFNANNVCNEMRIDINGEKKPNQWGKDLFIFVLKEDGLHPVGCDDNSSDCHKSGNGYTCACKVLKEGAINY